MFKKSAPVLLLGTLLLAVPLGATAQDSGKGGSKGGSTSVVPTAGSSGKVSVESLVQRYLPLAVSLTNAQSLVNGLRDGTEIALTGTIQETIRVPVQTQVTETIMVAVRRPAPPPALPGTFITAMVPQSVTKTVTTYKTDIIIKPVIVTFTPPTGNMGLGNVDIALALTEAVLTQQNIATPTIFQLQNALMDPNTGVLQLRAKKMGWADIAKTLGFEVK